MGDILVRMLPQVPLAELLLLRPGSIEEVYVPGFWTVATIAVQVQHLVLGHLMKVKHTQLSPLGFFGPNIYRICSSDKVCISYNNVFLLFLFNR